MPNHYTPSPFLQTYGLGSNTTRTPYTGGTPEFGPSAVGKVNVPEGTWLDNLSTRFRMNENWNSLLGTGNKVNDFVQTSAGGWGNVLGGLGSLMELYTGWKSLGLEEDKFEFSRDAWNKNFQAQVRDYENNLRDRWAARNEVERLAGRSGFMNEQAYLDQRGIGG